MYRKIDNRQSGNFNQHFFISMFASFSETTLKEKLVLQATASFIATTQKEKPVLQATYEKKKYTDLFRSIK